ncbi:hypothetical protein [Propionibacterium australiense]|nr:hypothetical protein [Propionibacterium australiense]
MAQALVIRVWLDEWCPRGFEVMPHGVVGTALGVTEPRLDAGARRLATC